MSESADIKSIQFRDISVSEEGLLQSSVIRDDQQTLQIRLPYSFAPSADLIAVSFALIVGKKFDHVTIDLPLGAELVGAIEHHIEAEFVCRKGSDRRRPTGTASSLNFSGGYDSLATLSLLPEVDLISLDFGGRFARERAGFEPFGSLAFETNLVDLRLNRYAYEFMLIGSILMRDELKLKNSFFGSILGGSLPRLLELPGRESESVVSLLNYIGMELYKPVAGVTEVGTMQMVAKSRSEALVTTLDTVANPREEKYSRKHQLLEAVCLDLGVPAALPTDPGARHPSRWGNSLATDLASVYVAQKLGVERVSKSYEGGVPELILDQIDSLDLRFLERWNPHAYSEVPIALLSKWYSSLIELGVVPYERRDWDAGENVVQLLRASSLTS